MSDRGTLTVDERRAMNERQGNPYRTLSNADARALWAVRVLDAWRSQSGHRSWGMGETPYTDTPYRCELNQLHVEQLVFTDCTDDAARLAAAQAVFPTLDRNAPNWPGECP